jgi:outer membrane lipoprotein
MSGLTHFNQVYEGEAEIMRFKLLLLTGLTVGLASCASTPPAPLAGNDFVPILPRTAQDDPGVVGEKVRWGGVIEGVRPGKTDTCFHVVSHTLDDSGRPMDDDHSDGRFIACAHGFFDPSIYSVKRQITVTGTLQVPTIGKVGDMRYIFPRVAADVVYLWPKDVPMDNSGMYYGMSPFGDPVMDGPMTPWMGPDIGMPW